MRRIREGYGKFRYQIKINGKWDTVAELQSNPFSFLRGAPDWELYFNQYGEKNSANNGNNMIGLYGDNLWDIVEKADKMVAKRLYKLADNILDALRAEWTDTE